MTLFSTRDRYGSVAVVLHWSIAVLIALAVVSGFAADAGGPDAVNAVRAHSVAALAAACLVVVRIVWWVVADRRPAPVEGGGRLQHIAARTVHILSYIVILGMTASGIGMMAGLDAFPALVAGEGAMLPDFEEVRPRAPHGVGARVLLALVALHAAAALYHQFVLKDGSLRRMWWPSKAEAHD